MKCFKCYKKSPNSNIFTVRNGMSVLYESPCILCVFQYVYSVCDINMIFRIDIVIYLPTRTQCPESESDHFFHCYMRLIYRTIEFTLCYSLLHAVQVWFIFSSNGCLTNTSKYNVKRKYHQGHAFISILMLIYLFIV